MDLHELPVAHLLGYPLQSTSTGVESFFSLIRSYFCFLVAAFRPCHGRLPRLKYISMYPSDSRSSRRLCSEEGSTGQLFHQYICPRTGTCIHNCRPYAIDAIASYLPTIFPHSQEGSVSWWQEDGTFYCDCRNACSCTAVFQVC